METATILKSKRQAMIIVRVISGISLFWFPFSFLAFLDPPQSRLTLPPLALKALYTLIAIGSLWYTAKIGVPQLKGAQTVMQLFLRSLACVGFTFICATCSLMAFLADTPHLGSPFIILPYAAAAVVVDWRYILPQMAAYQPTEDDLATAAK